jgi:hypothetical protein
LERSLRGLPLYLKRFEAYLFIERGLGRNNLLVNKIKSSTFAGKSI